MVKLPVLPGFYYDQRQASRCFWSVYASIGLLKLYFSLYFSFVREGEMLLRGSEYDALKELGTQPKLILSL